MRAILGLLLAAAPLWILTSCNNTRYLAADESLVHRNRIELETDAGFRQRNLLNDQLDDLPYQIPNKRFLGLTKTRLWIFNRANTKRETKFWWWLKNKVGERPVIFNQELMTRSAQTMESYLFNKGFLHAEVRPEAETTNGLTRLTFKAVTGQRWTINEITLPAGDTRAERAVRSAASETVLEPGAPLDFDVLEEERERITTALQNDGFFYFNKDFISFRIDTVGLDHRADVACVVNARDDGVDHQRFQLNEVTVFIQDRYDGLLDTVGYVLDTVDGYEIYSKERPFRPRLIRDGLLFGEGDRYRRADFQETQVKFANYGAFKFTNARFADRSDSLGRPLLDVYFFATRAKKQALSFDIEADHSIEGWTGSAIGVSYLNRNLSGGADQLRFRAGAGVEFQFLNARTNDVSILNSADLTLELNYALNRFIVPWRVKDPGRNSKVKTIFSLRYNFERRLDFYSLHSMNFSAGYDWYETPRKRHILNPINVNFFLLPEDRKTPLFQERLDSIPSLGRSFEERLIAGATYIFQMNNRTSQNDRSYLAFTGDIATSGNFLHGMFALVNKPRGNEPPYRIFNREYSQFVRLEGDIRHYFQWTPRVQIATRFIGGLAVPYANSDVIPFFQQFYSGGPNSIRAFQLRQLGPGSFSDGVIDNENLFFFDQAGDVKLEASAELRMEIYKWLRAAVFADVGNVWLLREDPDRPDGNFTGTFYRDLAVGTGAGARLDFDYFVIRFDLGIPLRDPRLPGRGKWTIGSGSTGYDELRDFVNLNLAIGYPF